MKRILLFLIVSTTLYACATNQVTGRKQLKLVPESEIQAMAKQEYRTFLSQNKVVSANVSRDAEMVRRVDWIVTGAPFPTIGIWLPSSFCPWTM